MFLIATRRPSPIEKPIARARTAVKELKIVVAGVRI